MSGYSRTPVSSMSRLSEGDHVITDDGLSGIVIAVPDDEAQLLKVVRFPVEDQRGPGCVVITDVTRQVLLFAVFTDILGACGTLSPTQILRNINQECEPIPNLTVARAPPRFPGDNRSQPWAL